MVLTAAGGLLALAAEPSGATHRGANGESEGATTSNTAITKTTNAYSRTSTSTDPDISCLDASLGTDGVLSIHCNYRDDSGAIAHKYSTVDLDDHAGCDTNNRLAWGETGLATEAVKLQVDTGTTGAVYRLAGQRLDGSDDELDIDDRFQNSNGTLRQDCPGAHAC